jgi:hypothetical protein
LPPSRIAGACPVKVRAPIRRPSAFKAYVACLQNTEMETSMTDQDRKQLATSFIEALRAGDANGFRAIMTNDVVWTLPGTSLVSGIAKGVEGILKRARCSVTLERARTLNLAKLVALLRRLRHLQASAAQ